MVVDDDNNRTIFANDLDTEKFILFIPSFEDACTEVDADLISFERSNDKMNLESLDNFQYDYQVLRDRTYANLTYCDDSPTEEYRVHIDEKNDEEIRIYDVLPKYIDTREPHSIWPVTTNISCWWCCHPFNTRPIPLPLSFSNGVFKVKGCFCSFNCCKTYANNTHYNQKINLPSLIVWLFRELTGETYTVIKPAPPRECLQMFGGHLNIEAFRKNFTDLTTIVLANYQVTSLNDQIKISKRVARDENESLSNDSNVQNIVPEKQIANKILRPTVIDRMDRRRKDSIKSIPSIPRDFDLESRMHSVSQKWREGREKLAQESSSSSKLMPANESQSHLGLDKINANKNKSKSLLHSAFHENDHISSIC